MHPVDVLAVQGTARVHARIAHWYVTSRCAAHMLPLRLLLLLLSTSQSVINFPPPKDLSFYITLHLPLQDEEDENLLAVLPRACAFIHTALTGSDGGMATGSEALLAPSSQEEGDADAADEGAAQANGISSAHAVAGAVAPGTAAAAVAAGGAAAASSSAQTAHVPGKVLVHCQAGMSRSVSVAAAYMMRVNGYDAHEAIRCMKDAGWKRAEPNDGFMAQVLNSRQCDCATSVAAVSLLH